MPVLANVIRYRALAKKEWRTKTEKYRKMEKRKGERSMYKEKKEVEKSPVILPKRKVKVKGAPESKLLLSQEASQAVNKYSTTTMCQFPPH